MKKRKTNKPIKVKPVKEPVGISTGPTGNFHLAFPHQLVHRDKDEVKTCWFVEEDHMKRYIERYKLKPSQFKISKTEPRST